MTPGQKILAGRGRIEVHMNMYCIWKYTINQHTTQLLLALEHVKVANKFL